MIVCIKNSGLSGSSFGVLWRDCSVAVDSGVTAGECTVDATLSTGIQSAQPPADAHSSLHTEISKVCRERQRT